MRGHETVRVGEVLRLERRRVMIDPVHEYRLIGVYSFGKGILHRDAAPGSELGDYRFFAVEPGDLVLSNIQAWEGAIAHAGPGDAGTIGTNRFLTYVPIAGNIDTNWLRWFFLSEPGMTLIRQAAPGTTMRNRTLAIKRFEALEIPLPPIEEQRRVVRLLDQAQAGKRTITELIHRAESIEAALEIALVSPMEFAHPCADLQGWKTVELGSVMKPSKSVVTVDPITSYRLTGVYSFGKGLIDRGQIAGSETSYRNLTVLRENDVIVSKLNGWEGAVAVVGSDFAGSCVSAEFPTFEIDQSQLLPRFFGALARSPRFWDALNDSARGSMVRRRRITPGEFLRASLRLPALEVQAEAVRQLSLLNQTLSPRRAASTRADSLVSALLNREFETAPG